jgi:DNA-binding response OmpR family regulator
MKERERWAFILDKDEFVRLSLKKILKKYGFEVEEIDDLSQIEHRKKDIGEGMILADMELEALERWLPFLKRWSHRFVLMSPLVTDDFAARVKKLDIGRIIKKPVDPRMLRKVIREMPFPGEAKVPLPGKKRGIPNPSERR